MKIYIINLKRDKDRRDIAQKQMDDLGVEFSFFDAIDAQAKQDYLLSKLNREQFLIHTGREPTLGELGCFESHYNIWMEAIEKQQNILVLEDDFELVGDLKAAIKLLPELANKYPFIRIEEEKFAKVKLKEQLIDFSIHRYTKPTQGATGYLITPTAAKKMVPFCREISFPIDYLTRYYYLTKIYAFSLRPFCIGKRTCPSTIESFGRRRKAKKALDIKIRRFILKCKHQLLRHRHNLFYKLGLHT